MCERDWDQLMLKHTIKIKSKSPLFLTGGDTALLLSSVLRKPRDLLLPRGLWLNPLMLAPGQRASPLPPPHRAVRTGLVVHQ